MNSSCCRSVSSICFLVLLSIVAILVPYLFLEFTYKFRGKIDGDASRGLYYSTLFVSYVRMLKAVNVSSTNRYPSFQNIYYIIDK
jgi:hypothetical protein